MVTIVQGGMIPLAAVQAQVAVTPVQTQQRTVKPSAEGQKGKKQERQKDGGESHPDKGQHLDTSA